jgi:hypothetical protein
MIVWQGEMQKEYLHGIPRRKKITENRLVVVFRRGEMKIYEHDMGKPCTSFNLLPKPNATPYIFGHVPGVNEQHWYSRAQLLNLGAHVYVFFNFHVPF